MPIKVELVEELGSDAFVYGHVALEGEDEQFTVRTDPRKAPNWARPSTSGPHRPPRVPLGDRPARPLSWTSTTADAVVDVKIRLGSAGEAPGAETVLGRAVRNSSFQEQLST